MSNLHPNGRILRRRVAWLLGKWVNKVRCPMRAAFQTFTCLPELDYSRLIPVLLEAAQLSFLKGRVCKRSYACWMWLVHELTCQLML